MSDFLNELNKTVESSVEKDIRLDFDATEVDKQKNEKKKQQREDFEAFIKRSIPNFQKICIDSVKNDCYVTYNDRRYIFCSIILLQNCHYGANGDSNRCSLMFGCSKLTKNHVLASKREYASNGKFVEFDYLQNTPDGQLEELGCELQPGTKFYSAPLYMPMLIAKVLKENMEGFVENERLPKNVTESNRDPLYRDYSFKRVDGFTRPLFTYEFLIKF